MSHARREAHLLRPPLLAGIHPRLQPRPTVGVQFVGIPEFPGLATKVSHGIAAAIVVRTSVTSALEGGQKLASVVAAKYRKD
ncbi:hypothetical protein ACH4TE_00920 [Streptomyces sioyaensis]|uniref:hypothetical protein n=1 Tax=Streptomyces sioyaensis TaxID=67364 RepID=UPI003797AC8A